MEEKNALTVRKEVRETQNKSDVRRCNSKKWEHLNNRLKKKSKQSKRKGKENRTLLLHILTVTSKKVKNDSCDKPTPTTSFVDCNCCNGSMILSELISTVVMVPRITAFQTRNKTSGILVPKTIAVLKNNKLITYTTYNINNVWQYTKTNYQIKWLYE